jgi:hypothetical protein
MKAPCTHDEITSSDEEEELLDAEGKTTFMHLKNLIMQ